MRAFFQIGYVRPFLKKGGDAEDVYKRQAVAEPWGLVRQRPRQSGQVQTAPEGERIQQGGQLSGSVGDVYKRQGIERARLAFVELRRDMRRPMP